MANFTVDQVELMQAGMRARQRQADFSLEEVADILEGLRGVQPTAEEIQQIADEGYRRESEVIYRAGALQADRWHAETDEEERQAADAEAERQSKLTEKESVREAVDAILKSQRVF